MPLTFPAINQQLVTQLRDPVRTLMVIGLHAASQFWLLSLMARYCDTTIVGYYVLGFAVAAPAIMFLNLRLRIVLANDVSVSDPTWALVRFRIITCSATLATITAGALAAYGVSMQTAIITLVGAIKAVEAFSDICYGGLQRLQQGRLVERSIVRRAALTIVCASLCLYLTRDAVTGLLAVLMIWSLAALLDWRNLKQKNSRTSSIETHVAGVLGIAKRYLPLGLAALLASLAYNVPRYFISAAGTAEQLAHYGVAAYFGQITLMAATAATEALIPSITQQHAGMLKSGHYLTAVRRVYRLIALTGAASLALGATAGHPLLLHFFGLGYAEHLDVLLMVQFASVFGALSICQVHVVIALGVYREQMLTALASFTLLIAASAVLVPAMGILGAACADIIYSLVFFVWIEALIHRHGRGEQPA
jgi:O-antigen/teichoic acid export membrane protein